MLSIFLQDLCPGVFSERAAGESLFFKKGFPRHFFPKNIDIPRSLFYNDFLVQKYSF